MSENELAAMKSFDSDSEGDEKEDQDVNDLPRIKSVDLRHAYSVFQSPLTPPVPLPKGWEGLDGYGLTPEFWGIIQDSPIWTIRRHKNNVPSSCFHLPPCAPQPATYSISAGKMMKNYELEKVKLGDDSSGIDDKRVLKEYEALGEIMRVDEVSSEYNRLCCRPYHPFKLEFKQYIPLPGDPSISNYDHLESKETSNVKEYYNQWKFSAAAMELGVKDLYNVQPVLFTLTRSDGQRWPYPIYTERNGYCKCLYAPSCYQWCQDGATMHAGEVKEVSEDIYQRGRFFGNVGDRNKLVGSIVQPVQQFIPTLHLRADGQRYPEDNPFGNHEGPCCFGGFLELCCEFQLAIYKFTDPAPDNVKEEGEESKEKTNEQRKPKVTTQQPRENDKKKQRFG